MGHVGILLLPQSSNRGIGESGIGMVCAAADVHVIGLMILSLLLQNPKLVVLVASGSHSCKGTYMASSTVPHATCARAAQGNASHISTPVRHERLQAVLSQYHHNYIG